MVQLVSSLFVRMFFPGYANPKNCEDDVNFRSSDEESTKSWW